MNPEIKTTEETRILGKKLKMSRQNNRTAELWKDFMLEKKACQSNISSALYSVQIYKQPQDLKNPQAEFEKWASVQTDDVQAFPDTWETMVIPAGQYAVFKYDKGPAAASQFFMQVFTQWLPQSKYELDARPHFEIIPENYMLMAGMVEEEIWIPIKVK